MHGWLTPIHPPGLMKKRLMHHQDQEIRMHDMVCHPHSVTLHLNSCMVAGLRVL